MNAAGSFQIVGDMGDEYRSNPSDGLIEE